jgi:hypothetical protein
MPQPSRRKFAALLASPAALLAAQAPPPAEDLAALARNQIKANSTRLADFKIDIAVEPAFAFKP